MLLLVRHVCNCFTDVHQYYAVICPWSLVFALRRISSSFRRNHLRWIGLIACANGSYRQDVNRVWNFKLTRALIYCIYISGFSYLSLVGFFVFVKRDFNGVYNTKDFSIL